MKREIEINRAVNSYISIYFGSYIRDVERAFRNGIEWADENPNSKTIAKYLYKEKGYLISLDGEIPTFEETMKDVQTYNAYKKEQWIEKACNWFRAQEEMIGISFQEDFIERFKMAMKQ